MSEIEITSDTAGGPSYDDLLEICMSLQKENEFLRSANSDMKRIAMERNLMESALKKIANAETSGDYGRDIACIRAIARIGLGEAH